MAEDKWGLEESVLNVLFFFFFFSKASSNRIANKKGCSKSPYVHFPSEAPCKNKLVIQ